MTPTSRRIVLCVVLTLAAVVRVRGIAFDLPFVYHPDEPFNVAIVQSIFERGDLNPHWFVYPTLFYYINALAYVPYYVVGSLLGAFHARADIGPLIELAMGVTKATQPGVMVLSRAVTAAFSTGAVALTYVAGMRLMRSPAVALFAALMMAIIPTGVALARYVTPDSFAVFFATASLVAIVLVYQQGRPLHYVAAGLLAGLTASTKYNAALVVLPLIAAHFLRPANRGLANPWLYVAGLCCCAGFVAGTPYAVIDAPAFIDFLRIDGQHYATGHPGMDGQPFRWYVAYMLGTAAVLYALSLLEIVRGVAARAKPVILLAVFPVAYFLFIISFQVRNDRTFVPLTPFLCLLGASFLVHAWTRAAQWGNRGRQRAAHAGLAALAAAAVMQPAITTLAETQRLMHPDGRETARAWIAANLPAGSRIAFESYSPFIDPGRYANVPVPRIVDHDLDWYEANGVRYVVFSQGMYGRYFLEPARYPGIVAKYERFFHGFHLLKAFDDGGYAIRIYEVARDRSAEPGRS